METEIHIGMLIRQKLKEDGRSAVWLARKMNRERSAVYKIFKAQDINTCQLAQISVILKYNFFVHYTDYVAMKMKV